MKWHRLDWLPWHKRLLRYIKRKLCRKKIVGWKARRECVILNDNWIVRIENGRRR